MNNYHLKNRTYQFILFQNKAYHDKNKSQTKPLVKSRPQSANQVRKSNSSQSKLTFKGKNLDLSFVSNSRNGPLNTSNQNLMNYYNESEDQLEQEQLNQSLNYNNSNLQRPQSASTDYFYRKYRSTSSYNSTINKENNKMSDNSLLQIQGSSTNFNPINNKFQIASNYLLNQTSNGLLSSKSKSHLRPSNKSHQSIRRKLEQKRIEDSNLQLLKNLSQIKPQVKSKRELDREFVLTQKYKNSLSNFKTSGSQKPKIVIMNKEYLSPILHNYIEKKNIESVQSPTEGKTQNYSQHNQHFPPKRFFRRTQNHYNNGFVYDEDDTINVNNYLTSKNQVYQNQNYGMNLEYNDPSINQQLTYQINQDLAKYKEEMDYRKVVYSSHHSNGLYQNSLQDNDQKQFQYIQQDDNYIEENNDNDQEDHYNKQSPQFNNQYNENDDYRYDQYMINNPNINQQIYNNDNEAEQDGQDEYEEEAYVDQNGDPINYYGFEERRMNEQSSQNVMRVRDLVNQMGSESYQILEGQNSNENQNDNNMQDSQQNKQIKSQQTQENKNHNNDDEEYIYDDEEESDINQNFHNKKNNQQQNGKSGRLINQQQINIQDNYQNYDKDYEEQYFEVDEENYPNYSEQNNQIQKQNHYEQGKYIYQNIASNQQEFVDNINHYQEEEIIEEVEDDEESNPKSNKGQSISHSKGNINSKYQNSQSVKPSKHNFSDHLLSYSSQQSMFNTPSFIQD